MTETPVVSSQRPKTVFSMWDMEFPMVFANGLNHYFGTGENRKQVLTDNNLTVMPGELVIMTGPSGSGKTTLLTLIGALRTVQDGSLMVKGQELGGLTSGQLTEVRRSIGFIFQAHNLFDSLTAFQNVQLALDLKQHTRADVVRKATEILTRLGLGHRIHYKPRALSGGQKQRVAIARALVNRPKLVLADEPTAALDEKSGHEVVTMFKEFAAGYGCTILIVTHDARILNVADRIVNVVDGRIASEIVVEETATICAFLQKCPVFANNSPAELTEFAQKMRKERYSRGNYIIRQGEVGDKFYLLVEGNVDVLVEGPDGAPRVVNKLTDGNYFGEVALMTGEARSASVKATEEVIVYSLAKADFVTALSNNTAFKEQLRRVFFNRT